MFKVVLERNDFPDVRVIAVTKYVTKENLEAYYEKGFREFGENRVEALLEKKSYFQRKEIKWHFIGHLQRNKCREVINKMDYLHSLESLLLAREIQKYAEKVIPCFIEVKISADENKYGVLPENLFSFYEEVAKYDKIKIIGLMCIATSSNNLSLIESEFTKMNELMCALNEKYHIELRELSMGMSQDYLIALKHKATFIRIGNLLLEK